MELLTTSPVLLILFYQVFTHFSLNRIAKESHIFMFLNLALYIFEIFSNAIVIPSAAKALPFQP